jgi:hypothetical protein
VTLNRTASFALRSTERRSSRGPMAMRSESTQVDLAMRVPHLTAVLFPGWLIGECPGLIVVTTNEE